MTSGANFIDDPRKWRVSKSGFSIRTGWNEDKTIIARYPGVSSPLDNEHFQKWLDAAFAICDLYNSLLQDAAPAQVLTDLHRAAIDHDDDMARLERNTPAPASPVALGDEAVKPENGRSWLTLAICASYANAMRAACIRELDAMKKEDEAAGTYPQGRGIYASIAKRLEALTINEPATTPASTLARKAAEEVVREWVSSLEYGHLPPGKISDLISRIERCFAAEGNQ